MTDQPQILCIGSVLWDTVGRAQIDMPPGADVPGHIKRQPGGVAMNIAMSLKKFGMHPVLLSAVGQDVEGRELLALAAEMGLETKFVCQNTARPTDRYMAVEAPGGLIAAIADAHGLEDAGDDILAPLRDGRLADADHPWTGPVVLDGNLTADLLKSIANDPTFTDCDLRVVPASPGKADRLNAFVGNGTAMLYVNLQEANTLCGKSFNHTADAATALKDKGVARVLVTNGAAPATVAGENYQHTLTPPGVHVLRVTGAGDVMMAAHIAADVAGKAPKEALQSALNATASYISSDTPL